MICGCGALGTVSANALVRSGVGRVRIIDRDFIELNNLQRQLLFDERDIAENLPKAEAAARALRAINSSVEIEAIVADLNYRNVDELLGGFDVIVDGTDNFEVRFLINDYAAKSGTPWIFAGCIGSEAQSMTIIPGRTPCLRCLMRVPPSAADSPTCETAGILASASGVIANLQSAEALKILSGNVDAINPGFVVIDLWDNSFRRLGLEGLKGGEPCPVCDEKRYEWLNGVQGSQTIRLCGRNAVQVAGSRGSVDLSRLAERLAAIGSATVNRFLLKANVEGYEFTVFPDGRAIIKGTDDPAVARTLYSRYVGN